jgi:hypothetical protein
MAIREHTCVSVLCDSCGDECWDDGIPHFDNRNEALTHLRRAGWLAVEGRILCADCAKQAICERTGHQLGDWHDGTESGVPRRIRWCDLCGGGTETDPPADELAVLVNAARIVNASAEHERRDYP